MRRIFFLLPAVVVAATIVQGLDVPVGAHHSEAPFYDSDKIVEIRGVVTVGSSGILTPSCTLT